METKICCNCGFAKNIDNFYFRKDDNKYRNVYKEYQYKSICEECWIIKCRQYSENSIGRKKEYDAIYYILNKNKKREQLKVYRLDNKEKIKEIRRKYRIRRLERRKERLKTDINFKIKYRLRIRLNDVLKGRYKSGSAVQDLGCSIDFLKEHLKKKFYDNPKTGDNMSWGNYGLYGWHIDHIIPLASFNLEDREQLLKACHYTNLQPLWAEDNLKKGSKIIQGD